MLAKTLCSAKPVNVIYHKLQIYVRNLEKTRYPLIRKNFLKINFKNINSKFIKNLILNGTEYLRLD